MEVIPAVDVLDGRVVRLRRGVFDSATDYASDPVSVAAGWHQSGAALVHVVDLGASRRGRSSGGLWTGLGAAGVPFQAGGGIRRAADVAAVLAAGARRVVMGTTAVWSPALLAEIAAEFGPERIVGAVDVRQDRARGSGWEDEGRPLADVVSDIVEVGVGRLMITAIARDGTLAGPDLDLVVRIAAEVPMPVIASGGIATLEDLRALAGSPVEGAVVGRALYEGRFSLTDALAAAGAS